MAPRARNSPALEKFLWRLDRAVQVGRLEEWDPSFARSVLGQSRRPRWSPSGEQLTTIRHLIAVLVEPAESLFNEEAYNGWAA